MLMLLIQVSLFVNVVGQHVITVGREADAPLETSRPDLASSYCEAKGKECRGSDLESVFAADPHQCHARCNRNPKCLLAFYGTDQICHMRATRCSTAQLQTSSGTSYYRLKNGEKCPSGQPAYVEASKAYSDSFCLIPDKSCPSHNLYPTPQNIQPFDDCLKTCAKITSCAGVDFNGKCSPKNYECSKDELVDAPGSDHYTRLEKGVTSCPSKPPECNGRKEVALMVIGTRVKRGCDWEYDNQDSTEDGPGLGTIYSEISEDGWVAVEWDSGYLNTYRMGDDDDDKYDLRFVSKCDNKGPQEAALMVIGTRVKRGCDWKWGNQDSTDNGPTIGTIYRELDNGWVKVKWDDGDRYSYRMGHDGKYDLRIYKCDNKGPQEAALMVIGTRVKRGCDWKWGNQDSTGNDGPTIGTIYTEQDVGWVGVKWDNGNDYFYRMGYDRRYDLKIYGQVCINKGPEEAAKMVAGKRIKRGCDWPTDWDSDGGPAGRGTVLRSLEDNKIEDEGRVTVVWDKYPLEEYTYYMSGGKYRLALA